jgi:hypothetical protein
MLDIMNYIALAIGWIVIAGIVYALIDELHEYWEHKMAKLWWINR